MRNYIGIIIIVAIITGSLFVTRFFFGRLKKNKSKTNYFKPSKIIRQPKLYRYVGISGLTVFLAIALFFLLAPERMIVDYENGIRLIAFLIFTAIAMPFIFFIVIQLLWKIEIKESSFIYRNWIGIKKEYQFENVEIKYKSSSTRFYQNGKHIVGISMLQENCQALDLAIEIYKSKTKQEKNKTKQN